MRTKAISGAMLMLLFIGVLTLAFKIQPVKASRTIYIKPDGSIDPPTAPIQRNGDNYTFTDDINGTIVVERDNITIDGNDHILEGEGSAHYQWDSYGFLLNGDNNIALSIDNVTITRTHIRNFGTGIGLIDSGYFVGNKIIDNNITNNCVGILVSASIWFKAYGQGQCMHACVFLA